MSEAQYAKLKGLMWPFRRHYWDLQEEQGEQLLELFLYALELKQAWLLRLAYFDGRHTSGFVEGLNNKLKVIKRYCFGLLDPGRYSRGFRSICRSGQGFCQY